MALSLSTNSFTAVHNLQVSRSKPYRKNDNHFVDENNHSLIRAYIGRSRLDSLGQLTCLLALEEKLWLYRNFFLPAMHLQKKRITKHQTLQRIHDQALTPLDRLFQRGSLSKTREIKLLETRKATNPIALRSQNEKLSFYDTELNLKELSGTLS